MIDFMSKHYYMILTLTHFLTIIINKMLWGEKDTTVK